MRWLLVVCIAACGSHTSSPPSRIGMTVETGYPGASAELTESSITIPIERALGQLPHLAEMQSRTAVGSSTIELAFEPGTDLVAVTADVQRALDGVASSLPAELPVRPSYRRVDHAIARYAFSGAMPAATIDELIERTTVKVSQVAGVSRVELCGARPHEIHVDIDLVALAGAALTPLEVVDAIHAESSVDELRAITLATRNGSRIRLADVAIVADNTATPACIAASERGFVAEMIVFAQPGADATEVRERVDAELATTRREVPSAISVDSIGVMHVFAIDLRSTRLDRIREATRPAGHVLIEQRGDMVRLGVDPADEVVAQVRAHLAELPDIVAADPDATLELTSASRDELVDLGRTIAKQHPGWIPLGIDRVLATKIDPDLNAAADLAVRMQDVTRTILIMGGMRAGASSSRLSQTPIIVRIASDPLSLNQIYLRNQSAVLVPLASIARTTEVSDGELLRAGQLPMVGFRIRAADVHGMDELHLPPAVRARVVHD